METETTLLHHPAGFRVTVIVATPNGIYSQILETSLHQTAHGFRYQSLSPIRLAYPITYLRLILLHFGTMQTIPEHNTYAPDRFTGLF